MVSFDVAGGKAKAFTRTYSFLASILPYAKADWEKLSIFLNLLIPKLPAPKEEDLSRRTDCIVRFLQDGLRVHFMENHDIFALDRAAKALQHRVERQVGDPEMLERRVDATFIAIADDNRLRRR